MNKNLRKLTYAAMFVAIYAVLEYVGSWTWGPIRFSVSTAAIAMSGIFLGPIYGGIVGGICDLLMFFLKNYAYGPINLGLTLGAILVGVVFGLLVYKKEKPILWIVLAQFIVSMFVHLVLDTYFLMAIYKIGFIPLVTQRYLVKLAVMPILMIIEIACVMTLKKNKDDLITKK